MKLIVFDLDQTLVDVIEFHDRAVATLFKRRYGVDARLVEIDFAGKSLVQNFVELGRLKGIPEEALKKDSSSLLNEYDANFVQLIPPDGSVFILPGVTKLLKEMSTRGHLCALYTGDSRAVAEAIFKATGLAEYFKVAVYGTESKSRVEMLRSAIYKAEQLSGRRFLGKDVVVVGDSVRDIETGKEVGALTIAVATGFHTTDMLRSKSPDHLFGNLNDTNAVLQAIG
ncbi:MAG: HAD family hydrolase [Chloroflexi bacterium]|nr:HAD family hydrolase [Chloroflexota bacterium]